MKHVPIGVSARHIHLSPAHLAVLFGDDAELTVMKQLYQPAHYAANETLIIAGPRKSIANVRVLGPLRRQTQVEISRTDTFALGIQAPLRASGRLEETPGIKLIGPKGELQLDQGVIVAQRHIHLHPSDAKKWSIDNGQWLTVRMNGERPLIFEHVIARVADHYVLEMHIDTDEGNAAGVVTGDMATILDG